MTAADIRRYVYSPETSSYNSEECRDDAEIALALQAAEITSCHQARARFRSGQELLHKLFVCIAGVADQLQTNFASDLRNILKCVFDMNATPPEPPPLKQPPSDLGGFVLPPEPPAECVDCPPADEGERDSIDSAEEVLADPAPLTAPEGGWSPPVSPSLPSHGPPGVPAPEPPLWVPDTESDHCMACTAIFTLLRRRHHCRNCGRLFCAKCTSNSAPLPRFGQPKPVRVCDECFRYQLTPFTVQHQTS